MLFSSLEFVYGFLPLTLFVYYVLPWRFKNIALLLSSLVFYYYGGQNSILIMLLIIAVNYFAAIKIEAGRRNGSSKIYLIAGAGVSLICLAVFKYADFFIGNINAAFGLKLPLPGLALPIGISFYTFQALSYITDVYRGNVTAQKNPVKLAAYISFFPQLIAGPIVRYTDIAPRLDRRENTAESFAEGISRFVIGLGKKVLLANVLYSFCQVFKAQSAPASLFFWIYAISYSLHLYYDFSGYSDMAIGLGKMFGFDLPENFNYPFAAVSISDFWRRWHITLGRWFRDYVYFPMGGSRKGSVRLIINLLTVWALTGLWHGASWNFVIWGLYFFLFIAGEKLIWGSFLKKLPNILRRIYVIPVLIVSFVIFDSTDIQDISRNLLGLIGAGTAGAADSVSLYYLKSYLPTILAGIFLATPAVKIVKAKLAENAKISAAFSFLRPFALAAVLIACTAFLVDGSFNPFLYFRF